MKIETLLQALPEELNFYDLGVLRDPRSSLSEVLRGASGFSFRIYPMNEKPVATFILVCPAGQEIEAFEELGNQLASQIANDQDLMITPPTRIRPKTLEILLNSGNPFTIKNYILDQGDEKVWVPAILMGDLDQKGEKCFV